MDELRLLVLKQIEENKNAYISADACGYESHKKYYSAHLKRLDKILLILR